MLGLRIPILKLFRHYLLPPSSKEQMFFKFKLIVQGRLSLIFSIAFSIAVHYAARRRGLEEVLAAIYSCPQSHAGQVRSA